MRSARGTYRAQTSDGRAKFACVVYGEGASSEGVTEKEYRDRGFQPPFEELPIKEEYEKKARRSKKGPKAPKVSVMKPKQSKRISKRRKP
jgi:hypothetical protein